MVNVRAGTQLTVVDSFKPYRLVTCCNVQPCRPPTVFTFYALPRPRRFIMNETCALVCLRMGEIAADAIRQCHTMRAP